MTVKDADTLKSYFNLTKVPVPSNYVDLVDTIFDQGSGGGGGGHDHDDRYVQLAMPNSILAVHTFNPSTYSAPFILGTKAQGQTVIGLKADQLNKSITAGEGLGGGGLLTDNISLDINFGMGLELGSENSIGLILPGTLSVSSINNPADHHSHAITSSSAPGAAASLLATNVSGVLELVTLKTEVLQDRGITGSILINPAGSISLDPSGGNVVPVTNYEINLGTINKKYLTLHAAELWVETLVAQDTMATIGGRILVAPTTTLVVDLPATQSNLLLNESFETAGLGGIDVFANWDDYANDGIILRDSAFKHSGTYSCKLTAGVTLNTKVEQFKSLEQDQGVTVRFWSRGSGLYDGYFGIWDAGKATWAYGPSRTGNTSTSWVETVITFSAPASGLYGLVLMCAQQNAVAVWFDDAYMFVDSIQVTHNQMISGDIVYLEANGKVEWMQIISAYSGGGPYTYFVERNLDGTGTNDWFAGDAVLNTGQTGNGYIDLYSMRSIRSTSQLGPTISGNLRIGNEYSNITEVWAIGNLNGLYGYGVNTYGAAFGKYISNSSFLTVDATNGIRMMWKNGVGANLTLAQWDISGNLTIGQTGASQDNIYISAGAINFRVNTTTYMSMTSAGVIQIGLSGAGQDNIYLASNEISLRVATTEYLNISTAGLITVGLATGPNTIIQSTGITLNNASTTYISMTSGGVITIGRVGASQDNIYMSSGAISIRNNTTERIGITAAGILTIKDSAGAAVLTFDSASGAEITKKLTMPGASSAIAIGATPPTSASSGTGIWIDRTGLYNLVSSSQTLKLDATTGALYIGAIDISQYPITVDGDGILFKQDGIGDSVATHIEFGTDHTTGLKGQIYFYYSGVGVFNILQIIANPTSNPGGNLFLHGNEILLQSSTDGITMQAGTGGVRIGSGLMVGDDITPPVIGTITLLDNNATPSYESGHSQLYGRYGSLFLQSGDNDRFNLNGCGVGGLLSPLAMAVPRFLYFVQGSTDVDLTPNHSKLSPNNMLASTYKNFRPQPMYIADFNGTTSFMSSNMTTYPAMDLRNWFSLGIWFYIDATGRNHGLVQSGATTSAWHVVWYNPGGYWEFTWYDTGGNPRAVQRTATLTTGWHFVGIERGWSASGNNHQLICYDGVISQTDNIVTPDIRAPAGDFTIGKTLVAAAFLDGKVAVIWAAGYMPASVGGNILDYFYQTKGYFWT